MVFCCAIYLYTYNIHFHSQSEFWSWCWNIVGILVKYMYTKRSLMVVDLLSFIVSYLHIIYKYILYIKSLSIINEYEHICTCTLWSMYDILHIVTIIYKSSISEALSSEIFIYDVCM